MYEESNMSVTVQDTREQSRLVWVLLQIDRRAALLDITTNKQSPCVSLPSTYFVFPPAAVLYVRYYYHHTSPLSCRVALHFAPTHAPLLHSLGGSLPFTRPNCSDLLALFPLSKLTITKFPTCHVCLCYTIMVSVFYIWIAFKFEKQLVDKTNT